MRKADRYIILIILFVFFYSEYGLSKIDNETTVRNIAQNFLNYKKLTQSQSLNSQPDYFIFEIEPLRNFSNNTLLAYIVKVKPKGFLIISPIMDQEPVIAYSFRNNWNSGITADHPLYDILVMDIELREKNPDHLYSQTYQTNNIGRKDYSALDNTEYSKTLQYPQEDSTDTGGWIETAWHQEYPYNQLCPIDPDSNKRSVVGCTALAMAQIVNYHKKLPFDNFNNAEDDYYFDDGCRIDRDSDKYNFPNFETLNTYLDTIRAKYGRGAELDSLEIAALCFACGVTLKLEYDFESTSTSFTWDIDDAFLLDGEYLNAAYLYNRQDANYEFDEVLINNLINGLPAILILKDHAIIADGYNTDGDFHLNWGWGGTNPDSITNCWTNIFNNWTYDDRGIQTGILNIRTSHRIWELEIEIEQEIELDDEYINETSSIRVKEIKNTGFYSIILDYIKISNNFYYELPDAIYFPAQKLSLPAFGATNVYLSYTPKELEWNYGKLEIFGHRINEYYTERIYINSILKGYGEAGTVIKKDTVSGIWSEDSSPYYIRGNISVTEGKKLIIEAGTKIIFKTSSEFNINENSQLIAKGTQSSPIEIISDNPDKGWQGLVFNESGSDDTLEYCIIKYANRTSQLPLSRGGGISIIKSSPFITHSTIIENRSILGGGGIYLNNSNSYIGNTRIENNSAKMDGGALSITGKSFPTLSNVTISYNYAERNGGGIYIDRSSIVNFDSTDRCNIFQNYSYKEIGNDLYSLSDDTISVVLDTFTVLSPDSTHAYPFNKFTFTIKSDPSKILLSNSEFPTEFILSQNFPNPYNPLTQIPFALTKPEIVKIDIYNIIGQKIQTLLNQPMPAGYHEVTFNGENLSSGIYLYRIDAGGWSDVKKMILLR